jgi:NAD(P)-dependent dehydrogenase (short-subunit alcohol dehydrogenase family)
MLLGGKVAVITGAGPGLGRTLARLMAEEGAAVVVSARSADTLEATAATGAVPIPADVSDRRQVKALAAAVLDRFGRVDVLINAAFPGTHRRNVLDMDEAYLDLWRRAVDIAAYGTLLCCRYFAPHMREGGSIVNLTSMSSRTGYAGRSDYAAGKAAVHLLSHTNAWRHPRRVPTCRLTYMDGNFGQAQG